MKIRCNGFTLIELLVSMLVVAIAMLGFAALQAFSSRSLSSTASKQSSSDALNAYVRFIESSRASIDTFKWNTTEDNKVTLTCDSITTDGVFDSAGVSAQAFQGTFNTLCNQYIRHRKDLLRIDFAVRLTRNLDVGGITGLTTYGAEVALVYQPIPQGRSKQQAVDVDDIKDFSQTKYCPFGIPENQAQTQKDRTKYNIVCNNVELSL